jgi:hypothetical protein
MPAPQKQLPPLLEQQDTKHSIPTQPPVEHTGQLVHDLGHYGGLHAPYRTEDTMSLELNAVKSAVRLAKQVNLATNTENLVVRDILPDKDFRDGNGNAISGRGWVQPASGWYEAVETDVPVYKINRDVDYHNKVYVFWGLRYIGRGPADENAVTDSASITIKDSVNTFDVWHTEGMDLNKEMYCFKPILVKNYVDFSIHVRPKVDASGRFDNYQLLGKIVEKAGDTVMGSPSKVDAPVG